MRIRTIKPEFWRSDDIAALSIEDRLLFIGLWSYVDDSGVGEDKLAAICADLFAPDMERDAPEVFARVQRGLTELSVRGLIIRYTVQGKRYIAIPTWKKHQRINRPSKSRFPGPEQADTPSEQAKQGCSCKVSEDSVSPHANYPLGTGEQGNRGTGEEESAIGIADDDGAAAEPKPEDTPTADLAPVDRPEVEALCQHLADRIEANGSKRPTVTKRWRDAARLMIDRDGRTVEQIRGAIDWATNDEFWRANILSMPKLRERYDQLRLQAQRRRPANGHQPGQPRLSTTDQRVAAGLALAERLRAQEQQRPRLEIAS